MEYVGVGIENTRGLKATCFAVYFPGDEGVMLTAWYMAAASETQTKKPRFQQNQLFQHNRADK